MSFLPSSNNQNLSFGNTKDTSQKIIPEDDLEAISNSSASTDTTEETKVQAPLDLNTNNPSISNPQIAAPVFQPKPSNKDCPILIVEEDEGEIELRIETPKEHEVVEIPTNEILGSGYDPRFLKAQKESQLKEKLNLVLDLDETLVNTLSCTPLEFSVIKHRFGDYAIKLDTPSGYLCVLIRPYLKQFLETVSSLYNIFIYSHRSFECVQLILELIDPHKKYIRRDIIFKRYENSPEKPEKKLSCLKLPNNQLRRTLIIDDQRDVWSDNEYLKVINSKKFVPLKDYRKDNKYSRYGLLKDQSGSWQVLYETQNEVKYYTEMSLERSQLLDLSRVLKDISKTWNVKRNAYSSIEQVLIEKKKEILKGKKVSIVTEDPKKVAMFEAVAVELGGIITPMQQAQTYFIDSILTRKLKDSLKRLKDEEPLREIYSLYSLLDGFFHFRAPSCPVNLE